MRSYQILSSGVYVTQVSGCSWKWDQPIYLLILNSLLSSNRYSAYYLQKKSLGHPIYVRFIPLILEDRLLHPEVSPYFFFMESTYINFFFLLIKAVVHTLVTQRIAIYHSSSLLSLISFKFRPGSTISSAW